MSEDLEHQRMMKYPCIFNTTSMFWIAKTMAGILIDRYRPQIMLNFAFVTTKIKVRVNRTHTHIYIHTHTHIYICIVRFTLTCILVEVREVRGGREMKGEEVRRTGDRGGSRIEKTQS